MNCRQCLSGERLQKDHGPDPENWRGRRVCSVSPGDYIKNTAIQCIKQCRKEKNRTNKKTEYLEKAVLQFTSTSLKF